METPRFEESREEIEISHNDPSYNRKEKKGKTEAGSSRGDSNSIIDLAATLASKLESVSTKYDPENFTIFRAPVRLREGDTDATYRPKMVSIGPYHRGKEDLRVMEEYKFRCLKNILERNQNLRLEDYIKSMEELEDEARGCYSEVIPMGSAEFVQMLLLDGCFIISVLLSLSKSGQNLDFPMVNTTWIPGTVHLDMLMLENQLPFVVLQTLYDLVTKQDEGSPQERMLAFLIVEFYDGWSPSKTMSLPGDINPCHILHLFAQACIKGSLTDRRWGRMSIDGMDNVTDGKGPRLEERYDDDDDDGSENDYVDEPQSFIGRLKRQIKKMLTKKEPISLTNRPPQNPTTRRAKELEEAGVKFKVKQEGKFSDVTFTDADGVLAMLPMYIYDDSHTLFRNLIALEQCNREKFGIEFTSYSYFVDGLIDTPEDAALLEKEGILINRMSSSEEVAQLINLITKRISFTPSKSSYLKHVLIGMDNHCNNCWPRSRAKLMRDYFNSPWSTIATIAAAILLLLSIAQTIFSGIQIVHP